MKRKGQALYAVGQAVHVTLELARATVLVVLTEAVSAFHAEVLCSQVTKSGP